jgi:formate hydrogenlyase subunit 4
VLALLVAALPADSTDLVAMSNASHGADIWREPAHWCGALAFALVVLVETGRRPIDNPDTHLELTMIHEGPLLEYAGRDLAFLHWGAAARHWIVAMLAAGLFLPHPSSFWWQLLILPLAVLVTCAALAVTETWLAKMRILRVPRFLAAGGALCVVGLVTWFVGVGP